MAVINYAYSINGFKIASKTLLNQLTPNAIKKEKCIISITGISIKFHTLNITCSCLLLTMIIIKLLSR